MIDGVSHFIRRGANEVDPTMMPIDVDEWNRLNHVEDWQKEAMIRGLHLGWDYALGKEDPPSRMWRVMVPLVAVGTVEAYSEDHVSEIVEEMRDGTFLNDERFSLSFDGGWELLEDPYPKKLELESEA